MSTDPAGLRARILIGHGVFGFARTDVSMLLGAARLASRPA